MPLPHYPGVELDFFNEKNIFKYSSCDLKSELNLNNPIFVCYIDTAGKTRQNAEEILHSQKNYFEQYSNITVWILPSNHTKIECIYDGFGRNRDNEISDLINKINNRVNVLSKSSNFDDFKINLRDWRIDNLTNGTE